MAEIKALFPVGKTQWQKWNDQQRTAFNEAREAGVGYADAIEAANKTRSLREPTTIFVTFTDAVEDVVEAVEDVAEVAPVVATAVRAVRGSKPKKGK